MLFADEFSFQYERKTAEEVPEGALLIMVNFVHIQKGLIRPSVDSEGKIR